MASRKTEVRGLIGRPMLSPEYAYFFVFAGAAGTFLLGCWAWYCHKFLQKNEMLLQACHRRVDREIGDIYSSMHKCYPFTRMLFNYKAVIVIQVS